VHGAPVHTGDPSELGIADLATPNWGDAVEVYENETPCFWACGVTPMAAAIASKIPYMITHSPGHMLILDKLETELLV
jgi:uncharacterized protein YcsI (UPF0317 family)